MCAEELANLTDDESDTHVLAEYYKIKIAE